MEHSSNIVFKTSTVSSTNEERLSSSQSYHVWNQTLNDVIEVIREDELETQCANSNNSNPCLVRSKSFEKILRHLKGTDGSSAEDHNEVTDLNYFGNDSNQQQDETVEEEDEHLAQLINNEENDALNQAGYFPTTDTKAKRYSNQIANNFHVDSYNTSSGSAIETYPVIKTETPFSSSPAIKRKRTTKAEMAELSEEQKNEKTREANRKNSEAYADRKKQKENYLTANLKEERENLKSFETRVANIKNLYDFFMTYIPKTFANGVWKFVDMFNLQNRIIYIENILVENEKRIETDENVQNLVDKLETLKTDFERAVNDEDTKIRNRSTYGVRKSRAKHAMETAEMEKDLKTIKMTIELFENVEPEIQGIEDSCKSQFINYMDITYIDRQEIYQMTPDDHAKFKAILNFFKLPEPSY